MIHNFILDWSGTIVDDFGAVLQATNAVLKEFGRPEMSREEFRQEFILPLDKFYGRFLSGVSLDEINRLYHLSFANCRNQVELHPGIREFLEFCRSTNRSLFILSTIQGAHFETQAARHGIRHFFKRVYLDITNKAVRIDAILAENHLKRDRTLFVGDMVHDIESGRYGGVLTVGVLTGFDSAEKLAGASPDLIVRNLSCLQQLLETSTAVENEWIEIVDQEVLCRIGVPAEERQTPQKLFVSLRFQIGRGFHDLDDQFKQTIDYAAVAAEVDRIATENEIHLVETLVGKIADRLMEVFPIYHIKVGVKKFILPNTKQIEVRTERTR